MKTWLLLILFCSQMASQGQIFYITPAGDTVQKSNGPSQSRGFKLIEPEIGDLKQYFGEGSFAIIGDTLQLKLNRETYPLNNNKFIVFYYKINGKQSSKKVAFDKQKLLIQKSKLIENPADSVNRDGIKNLYVYQFERSTKKAILITRVNLTFHSKEKIAKEFTLVQQYAKKESIPVDDMKKYLHTYFTDLYGETDEAALNRNITEFLSK